MNQSFLKHAYEFFKALVEVYKFRIKTELNEGPYSAIEYSSSSYIIKIENYFRELHVTLRKTNEPDGEINLFNLLEFLKQGELQIPKSEYFRNEKDLEECYIKQLNHIATVIYENYNLINDFFDSYVYQLMTVEFEKYWKNKHPEFYKKS